LTALAIADDLGAVLIIALFYTQNINMTLLGVAIGSIGAQFNLACVFRYGVNY